MKTKGVWVAEWCDYMQAYRVYVKGAPERAIAYDDDLENIKEAAKRLALRLEIIRG